MSRPEPAIVNTLDWETDPARGGYSDNPDDAGGPTMFGITIPTLASYCGREATRSDIQGLTLKECIDVYYWLWKQDPFEQLARQVLASKVYDIGFNAGPREGWTLLQRAVNDLGTAIDVDGVPGPQTFGAANSVNQGQLLLALCARQRAYYQGLINQHPSWVQFATPPGGWFDRAEWRG